MKYKITYKLHLIILFISIIFSAVYYNYLCSILFNFYMNLYPLLSNAHNSIYYLVIVLLIILIAIIHELIHGFMYICLGGKVKYKFKILYASTQEITQIPLTLSEFTIVLLAPVTMISLLSLLLPNWLGSLIFIANLIGSFGDIYMSFELLKYPYTSKIIDRHYGYDVIRGF